MGKSKVLFVNEELTKEELCLDILHHARESFRIYARVLFNNVACGNSECDMKGMAKVFHKCTCKGVYCCQKGCQVSHWPIHKAKCKFYLQEKRCKNESFRS